MADIERAKEFYGRLGWRLDQTPPGVVHFTPHGSACSVQFGTGLTSAAPGSGKGYLSVPDIEPPAPRCSPPVSKSMLSFIPGTDAPVEGLAPERRSYFSRAAFRDPDGNTWLLQEVTTRLPGGVEPGPAPFTSRTDLASALQRAAAAHGPDAVRGYPALRHTGDVLGPDVLACDERLRAAQRVETELLSGRSAPATAQDRGARLLTTAVRQALNAKRWGPLGGRGQ